MAKIHAYLLGDQVAAAEIYDSLIIKFPSFLDGYLSYHNYLNLCKRH